MGRRQRLNGDETDVVCARNTYRPPAGVSRYWKRRMNKRSRREAKAELRSER